MPEATMICCDCSEWMRNGDVVPNRFDSQIDAVGLISNRKTEENHENTVGLISMGKNGKAEVLVNCTGDVGRVLSSLSKMQMSGKADILVSLQTAQLALKHRKNKKQDQRIILFVGSPVVASEKQLIKAGKRLKKNNVAVDIISFGETEDNKSILEALINAVKSNDNSNLVEIESGKLISDALLGTPIFGMGGGGDFGGMGIGQSEQDQIAAATAASQAMANNNNNNNNNNDNNQFAEFGGIDPNMDPEMAMAIRMSLQEERQRQQNEEKNDNQDKDNANANANANADSNNADGNNDANKANDGGSQAPGAEKNDNNDAPKADTNTDSNNNANNNGDNENDNENDNDDIDMEDEDLLAALRMSLMTDDNDDGNANNNANNNASGADTNGSNKDNDDDDEQAMLNDLLTDLPGLNEDDLNDLLQDTGDGDNDGDKEKDKDKSS